MKFEYAPDPDGQPDPGEIVWTWVSDEHDIDQGEDRPILLVARDGEQLIGLPLSAEAHDHEDEARHGRHWMELGTGPWDPDGRPHEVHLNRIVRVEPRRVRREGAAVDRERFDAVVAAARHHLGV